MKTWTVPPHVRPTAKASSSLYPKRDDPAIARRQDLERLGHHRGLDASTGDANRTTSPSSDTAMAAPGSRGPEPSMSTTRASAITTFRFVATGRDRP